jgi:paraquat-inducible protein B
MSETIENAGPQRPGDPVVSRNRWGTWLVWLLPAVAALIGLSLVVHAWLGQGPDIDIQFKTAAGLEAGKTRVKYKDLTIGSVKSVRLSADGSHVTVGVALIKTDMDFVRADTRFWVVRPRISLAGISGIDTLVSGSYIAVDTGKSTESARTFQGMEGAPNIISGTPGRAFNLRTPDLGSLDIGSPIYYRRIEVGHVASYKLEADGKAVSLQLFIDAPYDKFVTRDTRFWNASGVDVSLGANGFQLKTESIAAVLGGGLAFGAPENSQAPIAPTNTMFTLLKDQETAMAPPDGPALPIQLRFERSLRGLSIGAPVEFAGVKVGRVVAMELDFDADRGRFPTIVGVEVFPQRLGRVLDKIEKRYSGDLNERSAQFLQALVEKGMRAKAKSGNLLTGQLYISFEAVPNAPRVSFDIAARPLELPTAGSDVDRIQEQAANIVAKIDRIPLDDIGRKLDSSLGSLDKTMKQVRETTLPQANQAMHTLNSTLDQVDKKVLPEATQTLQQARETVGAARGIVADDAPLQQNLNQTLRELQKSARSLRTLTDLLGREPEALIRGRANLKQTPSSNPVPQTPEKTR